MATIKGQNLRILLGTSASNLKCISVAQSCVLHVSAQVGESSSKDSPSEWQEQEITAINWDVQVDALITMTADGGVLVSGLTVGETYVLRMSQTAASDNNRTPIANRLQLTGEAILSDLTLVAKDKDFATWSAKFIGDGALSQYS